MQQSLDDFLTRLNATAMAEETWAVTLEFFKSQGFNFTSYGYAAPPTPESPELSVIFHNNYPGWYDQRYAKMNYAVRDPSILHCVTRLTPARTGVEGLRREGLEPTGSARQLVQETAEFGMRTGVVFPMRSAGRHKLAGMSVANSMEVDEFDRFLADRKLMVHLAVMYAHTRIQIQLAAEEAATVHLTPRERECLLWTGKGLTTKQIARVSPKAVDFHVANAMRSLGASTRTHAVARAMAIGAIEL